MSIRTTCVVTLCGMLLMASAGRALAQNLFEVQVFPDEIVGRGETEVEFHSVLMPSGTRLPDGTVDPKSHTHLSFELSHGWNDRFETGVFLETSPSIDDNHPAFTGFHFRPKYRFSEWQRFPFHVSVSLEYAFVKQPGDTDFREALAITPILERHLGAFEMSFNPALEVGLRGPQAGESPVFEPSAKLASKVSGAVWLGVEYYAETGPIKQFEPLAEQHHLLFPTVDVRGASGWNVNVGVGRGLTGGSEHWVVKTIIGRSLTPDR
jgi:hypothetical protein